MGFRFRKSVRIAPGIRLNFSKSGTNLSVGTKGATVNLSGRGTRTTVGIPGTGISYSESARWNSGRFEEGIGNSVSRSNRGRIIGWIVLVIVIWLLSKLL